MDYYIIYNFVLQLCNACSNPSTLAGTECCVSLLRIIIQSQFWRIQKPSGSSNDRIWTLDLKTSAKLHILSFRSFQKTHGMSWMFFIHSNIRVACTRNNNECDLFTQVDEGMENYCLFGADIWNMGIPVSTCILWSIDELDFFYHRYNQWYNFINPFNCRNMRATRHILEGERWPSDGKDADIGEISKRISIRFRRMYFMHCSILWSYCSDISLGRKIEYRPDRCEHYNMALGVVAEHRSAIFHQSIPPFRDA